ncbi:NACHT domain-containing protein [Actinacidiphila oryziradicis]|nr:NACHT domain-containing protein [Actinacidiphila oryziradicis]
MSGGRRERRFIRWFVALSVVAVAAAAWWVGAQLRAGVSAVDAVTLLGLPIALVSVAIAVPGLRQDLTASMQTEDDTGAARAAAANLARDIAQAEGGQLQRMVGGVHERINLRYTLEVANDLAAAAAPASEGRLVDEVVTAAVPGIASFYRGTRPARLVVTGSPGGGKSVLALFLLIELSSHRSETDPVPVRLSMAGWDLQAAPSLRDFLVQHLVHNLDQPPKRAELLVRHGLILPVLDGLDEMDPTLTQDGHLVLDIDGNPVPDPDAPRARAALDLLNAYQDGQDLLAPGPLVLTCRGAHYDALPDVDRLRTAARIRIAHVTPGDAVTYLERRGIGIARWQPLLQHLRDRPTSLLAHTLSTPWRLSLAATVYRHEGDPTDLLSHPSPVELDDHLLARLIPSVTALTPNPRDYTPDQVHAWLHHLTHTTSPGATDSSGGTDLALHRLWPLAGRRAVRATDAILTTLTVLLLSAPLTFVIAPQPFTAEIFVFVFALTAGAWAGRRNVRMPRRLRWRSLRTPAGMRAAIRVFREEQGKWFDRLVDMPYRFFAVTFAWFAAAYAMTAVLVSGLGIIELPVWLPKPLRPDAFLIPNDPNSSRTGHVFTSLFFGFFYGAIIEVLVILLPAILIAVPISVLGGLAAALTDAPAAADRPTKII